MELFLASELRLEEFIRNELKLAHFNRFRHRPLSVTGLEVIVGLKVFGRPDFSLALKSFFFRVGVVIATQVATQMTSNF